MTDVHKPRVLQMRLVVEAGDYDEAVAFYRDVLGAPEELRIHGENGEKVTILDVGRATLEISNPQQVDMIDELEVGHAAISDHQRPGRRTVRSWIRPSPSWHRVWVTPSRSPKEGSS